MKKDYRIGGLYTFFLFPLYLVLGFSFGYFGFLKYEEIDGDTAFVSLAFVLSLYFIAKTAYKIEIEENFVTFYTLLGTKKLNVDDIVSMSESVFIVKVNYKGGSINISTLTDNFSELKNSIKRITNASYKMD